MKTTTPPHPTDTTKVLAPFGLDADAPQEGGATIAQCKEIFRAVGGMELPCLLPDGHEDCHRCDGWQWETGKAAQPIIPPQLTLADVDERIARALEALSWRCTVAGLRGWAAPAKEAAAELRKGAES